MLGITHQVDDIFWLSCVFDVFKIKKIARINHNLVVIDFIYF